MESSVGSHPLLAGAQAIEAALEGMASCNPAFLEPDLKGALLVQLARLEARLVAVRLQAMAVADDVAGLVGARDVAAALTHETRGDAAANRRDLTLARSLDRRWGRVGSALSAGDVNVAQALVIARALDEVPGDCVDREILDRAEAHLVAEAAHYGPRELRVLGRRVLDHVAPEVGEREEARQLAAEERRAREGTRLTMTRLGDGSTRVQIQVPDAMAARLRTYLDSFTSPRHRGSGEGDRIPHHRMLGQAFCSLLEAVDPRRLPMHAGDATTLIVTIPFADLTERLSAAGLVGDSALSAAEARRLACTSNVIPAVLGGRSEVLDLGRRSRLFTPAQRKAMMIRDRECRAEGCSIPATWCEAHHGGTPWSRGGRTDLRDGVLLCAWHHHRAHDPSYESSRTPEGRMRFSRQQPGHGPPGG